MESVVGCIETVNVEVTDEHSPLRHLRLLQISVSFSGVGANFTRPLKGQL